MEVTDQLLDHLASLSKLSFKEEEREGLRTDLQKMIDFVNKLSEVDTTGVAPLTHMCRPAAMLRDDVPGGMLSQEDALGNAPAVSGGFFVVPKVINPQ